CAGGDVDVAGFLVELVESFDGNLMTDLRGIPDDPHAFQIVDNPLGELPLAIFGLSVGEPCARFPCWIPWQVESGPAREVDVSGLLMAPSQSRKPDTGWHTATR